MELIKLIGFLLPPAIDLINKRIKNSDIRFWVSVAFCSIIGFGISYFTFGGIAPIGNIVDTIFVVFGTAQLAYKGAYEGSVTQQAIRG